MIKSIVNRHNLIAASVMVVALGAAGSAATTTHKGGMVLIPAQGKSFLMGQAGIADTEHTVSFTYNYWMDTTEVTQADFGSLMNFNPSYYPNEFAPVEMVTWYDAALYCNKRSKRDHLDTFYVYTGKNVNTNGNGNTITGLVNLTYRPDGRGYRLPTEAEWEFAARTGSATTYDWGDTVNGDYCWYQVNSNQTTHLVAQKKPNSFGLYDMIGNVLEWTMNVTAQSNYAALAVADPQPIVSGLASARGGKFSSMPSEMPPALRYRSLASYVSSGTYGFRVVQSVDLVSIGNSRHSQSPGSHSSIKNSFGIRGRCGLSIAHGKGRYDLHGRLISGKVAEMKMSMSRF